MWIIPDALGKLAKDFKVETQKDHFPHYFNPLELHGRLDWTGPLPAYKYFEPKRTSPTDYEEMIKEFKDKLKNIYNFIFIWDKILIHLFLIEIKFVLFRILFTILFYFFILFFELSNENTIVMIKKFS